MALEYHPQKIKDLMSRNETDHVVLPNFQRPFVWGADKQKELIASLLVDLPVGSLLILKGNKGDFSARKLCSSDAITPRDECDYVLDGQQRLSTIKSILYDLFRDKANWKSSFDSTFNLLHIRWFLLVSPKGYSDDLLGYDSLEFNPFSRYEQDQFIPYIGYEKIKKNEENKWYHPAFTMKNADGQIMGPKQLSNHIKKQAAKQQKIPLYEIYKGVEGLHRLVLEELAHERASELIAACKDGNKKASDYFDPEEIDINDWEEIQKAFHKRATGWAINTAIEIEKSVERSIPAIVLTTDEISRAVSIFEAVNRGGTPLSVYDLVVARAARTGDFTLSDIITTKLKTPYDISPIYDHTKLLEFKDDPSSLITWNPDFMDVVSDDLPSKEIQPQILNILSLVAYCIVGKSNVDGTVVRQDIAIDYPENRIKRTL